MKRKRHAAIVRIIRSERVGSQEQLRDLLARDGIDVTQATLSRDIRDLGLVKTPHSDGGARYEVAAEREIPHPSLTQLLPALLLSVDGVGPLIVARTPQGSAEALGSSLDAAAWQDVIGTIAGDDTLLIIARGDKARRDVMRRLETMAGIEGEGDLP